MIYRVFILIAAVSIAFYANSFTNGFVYDDSIYVVDNPHIMDIRNISSSFVHPEYLTSLGHKSHFRPLVMISYTINHWIGGLNPAIYRMTNLLFHIGTAFILFLIIKAILDTSEQITKNSQQLAVSSKQNNLTAYSSLFTANYIALSSALIFAVHPFNSEVVNYITARSSLMSGFFYLLAFYCWVRFRQVTGKRLQVEGNKSQVKGEEKPEEQSPATYNLQPFTFYIGSLLAFVLGMLSKEVVVSLPLAFLLFDIYFRRGSLQRLRGYLPYLPFILLLAAALVVRAVSSGGGIIPAFKRDMTTQIYTMIPVLVQYLKLLILPTGLNIAHDVEIYDTPFAVPVMVYALVLILYVINAAYLYRRRETGWRLLSFFMIWYFITLIIIIVMPLNRVMQENRCYISGAVFAVAIGIVLWELFYVRQRYRLAYGILVLFVVIYGIGTTYRNMVWANGVTLWADAVAKSPYETLVYNNLSVAYKDLGDYEKAKEALYKGIRLSPGDWLLHYNLGILYVMTNELDNALVAFDRAIIYNPGDVQVYSEKGNVYLIRGDVETGMRLLQEALRRKPKYALTHYYMAKAFQELGRLNEAKKELDLALRYAKASNDVRLTERITRYMEEGTLKEEIVYE